MNLLSDILRLLKPLLYPFSLLYGLVVWLRNKLYDVGLLSGVRFSLPVISVGNLSVGGTGKTPHIEYLLRLLQYEYRVATMSRGYKRKSRGFILADQNSSALEIGDEPAQFLYKFPETAVSVCEDRMTGIPELLSRRPDTDVILLDDAFQHRSVKPGLNILITDYNRPYFKDFILPFGRLREGRSAFRRADIIIVSKCPYSLSDVGQKIFLERMKPLPHQQVFFTVMTYGLLYDFYTGTSYDVREQQHIVLVCGIARPEPIVKYLQAYDHLVHLLSYPDHHYFSDQNIEEIKTAYNNLPEKNRIIVTTEKDAARLALKKEQLSALNLPLYILPIEVTFLDDDTGFDNLVKQYIRQEQSENDDFFDA